MPRYRLCIEYHGGRYAGWQRQKSDRSVQQTLEDALAAVEPARPSVYGAGRTDVGVHALGQVAHVDLARDWEPERLQAAANTQLKYESIAVLDARQVAEDFHARHDAIERVYLYRITARTAPAAIERGLVWHRPENLDAENMHEAAQHLIGHHDFTTFRSTQCQASSPLRTLDEISVHRTGGQIRIRARARSFLHRQVRSMVGTLERVGAGRWKIEEVRTALEARDRTACGPVAPPDGLYLEEVRYG